MTIPSRAALIDELTSVVSQAAAAILAVRAGSLSAGVKPDRSPVTAADEASQAVLLDGMARLLPGVPVISEEAVERVDLTTIRDEFILIDPLDGTRELLAGRDEFTINVAIVRGGAPVLGIVAAPAIGLIWRTAAGKGAERLRLAPGGLATAAVERTTIRTRVAPKSGLVAAISRSHLDPATEAFLKRVTDAAPIVCGSAIKFCRVAEGTADIYPRFAPTSQWDIAAGHAVLAAAGGTVTTPQGQPLVYRPAEGLIVPAFIAWGDMAAMARLRL